MIIPKRGNKKKWTMVGTCIDIVPAKGVIWKFADGPLTGTESWIVQTEDHGCRMIKCLDYEVRGFMKKCFWQLFGRYVHARSCKRELRKLKRLVEKQER